MARPSYRTAHASPPQISFAPLTPKRRHLRLVFSDGLPSRSQIPALHRLDRQSIADFHAVNFNQRRQRRCRPMRNDVVAWHVEAEGLQIIAEARDAVERTNLGVVAEFHILRLPAVGAVVPKRRLHSNNLPTSRSAQSMRISRLPRRPRRQNSWWSCFPSVVITRRIIFFRPPRREPAAHRRDARPPNPDRE